MKSKFAEQGGEIDGVYFCPHHPEYGIGKYRRVCEFRKPAPGMLLQAQRELGIDMKKSIFIGDKQSDMAAGRSAGIGMLLHLCLEHAESANIVISKLSEATCYLCGPTR